MRWPTSGATHLQLVLDPITAESIEIVGQVLATWTASRERSVASRMAYDEELAERIRAEVAGERGVTEMKMFGGLAFLIGGHMAVAASGQGGLMLRCDPDDTEALLGEPGAAGVRDARQGHAGLAARRGRAPSRTTRPSGPGSRAGRRTPGPSRPRR